MRCHPSVSSTVIAVSAAMPFEVVNVAMILNQRSGIASVLSLSGLTHHSNHCYHSIFPYLLYLPHSRLLHCSSRWRTCAVADAGDDARDAAGVRSEAETESMATMQHAFDKQECRTQIHAISGSQSLRCSCRRCWSKAAVNHDDPRMRQSCSQEARAYNGFQ